jgi:ribonuclease T1
VQRLEFLRQQRYDKGLIFKGYPVFSTGFAVQGQQMWQAFRQGVSRRAAALGLVVVAAAIGTISPHVAAKTAEPSGGAAVVALVTLPVEAQTTHKLILAGGPFPYDKDGTVFGNRERLLPAKARGFYREYTVKTPKAKNRGARRIVCGGKPPTQPEACFYTDDHYASFRRIVP